MTWCSSALSLSCDWRSPSCGFPIYVPAGAWISNELSCGYCGSYSTSLRFHSSTRHPSIRHLTSVAVIDVWSHVSQQKNRVGKQNLSSRAAHIENGTEKGCYGTGDQLLQCISQEAEVSVFCVVATGVVQEAQQRHRTAPTASAALGRALMGTLLLGALKGEAETVQVSFLGEGSLGQMTTISSRDGFVKGFVGNPLCDPPLKSSGKLDVGAAVGSGIISVVRNHSNWRQPYTGTVPIYSGEVAEDIAHYLADSEQVNTALGLGVSFSRDSDVRFAGGFLVQVLPFCSEETIGRLEHNILTMPPISDAVEGLTAMDIVEFLLKDIGIGDLSLLAEPRFGPCTVEELKPRMIRAVASLGPSDVKEILDEHGHVEVRCEFCAEVVRFVETDLEYILQSAP